MATIEVLDLGRISYEVAYERQKALLTEVAEGARPNTLVLVEHDPILTLGAGFHEENLLFPQATYEQRGISVKATDRGGDVTFHGPGQLVIYPIFSLDLVGRDLHRWLRQLEQTIIDALEAWGLTGSRNAVNTGVWIDNRKICAIGIKVSRRVSMHGLALNCNVDLNQFGLFVPCGIRGDFGVTSLSAELGRNVTIEEAKPVVIEAFQRRFGGPCEL